MYKGYQEVPENFDCAVIPLPYPSGLECLKLRGYSCILKYEIVTGEFKGSYIGEVLQGLPHPVIIIPAEDITINS